MLQKAPAAYLEIAAPQFLVRHTPALRCCNTFGNCGAAICGAIASLALAVFAATFYCSVPLQCNIRKCATQHMVQLKCVATSPGSIFGNRGAAIFGAAHPGVALLQHIWKLRRRNFWCNCVSCFGMQMRPGVASRHIWKLWRRCCCAMILLCWRANTPRRCVVATHLEITAPQREIAAPQP